MSDDWNEFVALMADAGWTEGANGCFVRKRRPGGAVVTHVYYAESGEYVASANFTYREMVGSWREWLRLGKVPPSEGGA